MIWLAQNGFSGKKKEEEKSEHHGSGVFAFDSGYARKRARCHGSHRQEGFWTFHVKLLHLNCESGATAAVTKMKTPDKKGHVFPLPIESDLPFYLAARLIKGEIM